MKKNVYINIGNSSISFGYNESNNIKDLEILKIKSKEVCSKGLIFFEILEKIKEKIYIEKIYIVSVVDKYSKIIKTVLKKMDINYKFLSHDDFNFLDLSKLYNSYELGNDILAQSYYISKFFDEAIVVSCGTATAIYHLKRGKFEGIIIFPGISQSMKTLIETTDIQDVELLNINKTLGVSTNEAVSIGLIHSVQNFVDKLLDNACEGCPVVCSGGDSKHFSNNNWWNIDNLEILGLYTMIENKEEK